MSMFKGIKGASVAFDRVASDEVAAVAELKNDYRDGQRTWSAQQQAIFGWFENAAQNRSRNLVIRARAGTGKTTTVVEALKHAPEKAILFAAFNRRIADELQAKLRGTRAQANTLHGVGMACVRNYWQLQREAVDKDKGERMVRLALPERLRNNAPWELIKICKDLAGKGKLIHPLDATEENLIDLAISFDLIPDDRLAVDWPLEKVAGIALEAMRLASVTNDSTIDYDDMLFLPLVNGWAHGRHDLVVIDEAQDMNPAQLLLAQRVCKPGKDGRIVVVGDDRQCIYSFMGASMASFDNLKTTLEADELGLTITYRCPKAVVEVAQEWVPDYRAADSAPAGEVVDDMPIQKLMTVAKQGDFILSRSNAPLAPIALAFMRAGKKAKIEGRDIGAGLQALIRKTKASGIPELFKKLGNWQKKEIDRAQGLSKKSAIDARVAYVQDQVQTIIELADGIVGVSDLGKRIEMLFSDTSSANNIVCSTVHKAKGLESDTVYILDDTFKRDGVEEDNLRYVAATRAKKTLVYVSGDLKEKEY